MRKPRVIKVRHDQAVERDLHQQIEVELAENPQRIAGAFWPEVTVPEPRDQRMKIPRIQELRRELQRRRLLLREIVSERHLNQATPAPRAIRCFLVPVEAMTEPPVCLGRWADQAEAISLQSGNRQRDDKLGQPRRSVATANLVAALPEILASIPVGDRPLAERALIVPLVSARNEDLARVISTQTPGAFDFVIVDGIVLKETILARRSAFELLGRGDILAPPLTPARQLESRASSRYLAHGHVSLAAIDDHFRRAARQWPGIADFLHDRLARQTHQASMHLAMLHLPRIEDRITALFSDLAERFGHMTPDGVLIDLPLTHEIIGGLVASRRPTVTLALQQLASDGLITRLESDHWKLDRSILAV